jgi:hypothetical protein
MQYPTQPTYPPTYPTVPQPQLQPPSAWRRGLTTALVIVVSLGVATALAVTLPSSVKSARAHAYPKPSVGINIQPSGQAQIGATITFTATVSAGADLTFAWDFGDQSSGTGQTVTHSYQNSGPESISLTATDPIAQSATATTNITVLPAPPTAALSCSAYGGGTLYVTCNASASTGENIQQYAWDWGDGSTETTQGPYNYHQYVAAGPYTITLRVTDDANQTNSTSQSVDVS